MATASFRSTSRRTSIGGDSSNRHRRSRSVSRFPEPEPDNPPSITRRGKFVNTVRGSGSGSGSAFPEISLDDLAIEMFSLSDVSSSANCSNNNNDNDTASGRRGRGSGAVSDCETGSNRRGSSVTRRGTRVSSSISDGIGGEIRVSHRRGRSVSRHGPTVADLRSSGSSNNNDDGGSGSGSGKNGRIGGEVRVSDRRGRSVSRHGPRASEFWTANNNSNGDGGKNGRIGGEVRVSDRRGRSVSRHGARVGDLRSSGSCKSMNVRDGGIGGKIRDCDNGSLRSRRRSLSVAPKTDLVFDYENEQFQKNRNLADSTHQKSFQKPTSSSQQRGLRRCNSQKDLSRSYDGYTSYSSTFTDDEGNGARYIGREIEKGMRVPSAFEKGPRMSSRDRNSKLYKEVQKEYTLPGRDNKLDVDDKKLPGSTINDGRRSADSDVLKVVSTIRRNYKTKLEESEKRKEELLAEILLEEERGKELKKIVVDLLPNAKEISPVKRPMRGRKRSVDRTRVSKQLVEDADKIIEDFISSVEDTDISSFDGERSDTSSIAGGTINPMVRYGHIEPFRSPLRSELHAGEMDGVVLPWLKWETGDDATPLPGKDFKQHPATPKTVLQNALEERTGQTEQEPSVNSRSSHGSSRGSWSPGIANSFCMDIDEASRTGEVESCKNQLLARVPRRSRVDIDDYLKPPSDESIVSETWKQREIIHSGGLLICNSSSFGKFIV